VARSAQSRSVLAEVAGSGVSVVVGLCHGGGKGVYDESEAALELLAHQGALVVFLAANEAGIDLPVLHHWGTLHSTKLALWEQERASRGHPRDYVRWTCSPSPSADRVADRWKGGSSGLHLVDIALNGLGLPRVILCGVPMDERMNQFRGTPWGARSHVFRAAWTDRETLPVLARQVRSMAGWTRDLLGEPDADWLLGP
jgi:hypothetical protein